MQEWTNYGAVFLSIRKGMDGWEKPQNVSKKTDH
jgi:hypothetical protein